MSQGASGTGPWRRAKRQAQAVARRELAPPGPKQERGCLLKRQYATKAAAKRMRRRGDLQSARAADLDVYRCAFCGYFHLGKKAAWVAAGKQEAA